MHGAVAVGTERCQIDRRIVCAGHGQKGQGLEMMDLDDPPGFPIDGSRLDAAACALLAVQPDAEQAVSRVAFAAPDCRVKR